MDPNVYTYDGTILNRLRGKQLISKCISRTPEPTIKDLCENPDVDKDLETMIPVTDLSTELHYRNQYCAICSNQTSFDRIRRWKMNTDCEDDVSFTYEKLYEIFKRRTCNVSFESPTYVPYVSCTTYEIETCNVSGHWNMYNETLEHACNSFIDPFNLTYRNVFCFLCNVDTSISVDLWQCQTLKFNDTQDIAIVTTINVPFLAMLDLSAVAMRHTFFQTVQLQCNKHAQFTDEKVVSILILA